MATHQHPDQAFKGRAARATRSDSARLTAPGCAPVLGELLRGKTDPTPFLFAGALYSWHS